jgi:hypothetical protein
MSRPPLSSERYSRRAPPSVVPRIWRWLARLLLLAGALACSFFIGKTVYDQMRRVHPAPELSWPDMRMIKPSGMGIREFHQNVGLQRRFVEDSMRTLLPASINVLTIWGTCGESNCVRPSLANLMSLQDKALHQQQFVQRVCGLGNRFLGANIAGVVWRFEASSEKCLAQNWDQISQEVKTANAQASVVGLSSAVLLALILVLSGVLVLRAIERRIDANDREISIEN